jgi:myo-inositol 2-dehydrogenase/D-chiro-inositol 1-dehydrogenase
VRVVSVADPDEGRRNQAGELLDVDARYRDVSELLTGVPVDAVGICVPAASHADVAIEALAAGRHVLVEKPLAQTLEDCDRIVDAAAASGVTAGVGLNYRCHPLVRKARRVVEAGALGPLVMIQTSYTNASLRRPGRPDWAAEATSMLEKGVHDFDLWRLLSGSEVTTVVAIGRDAGQGDATAGLLARLENGTFCISGLSGESGGGHLLSLCGQQRRLDLNLEPRKTLGLVTAGRPRRIAADGLAGLATSVRGSPGALVAGRRDLAASFAGEWEEFAAAVRGSRAPAATLADGRAAGAIALAATRSLSEGSVAVSPSAAPSS